MQIGRVMRKVLPWVVVLGVAASYKDPGGKYQGQRGVTLPRT